MTTNYIGKPESRVDGKLKVTGAAKYAAELKVIGAAKYAAEFNVPDLLYGYIVSSHIAKGKITGFDLEKALALPGVVQIFTHENRPRTAWFDSSYQNEVAPPGSPFRPLYSENILHSQQPIALVVAEDFETARYAAALVGVDYEVAPHETDLDNVREQGYRPKLRSTTTAPTSRGDAQAAYDKAAVRHEAEYLQPVEHHNPMEMFASTVDYGAGGKLTIYEKTQGAINCQKYVTNVFSLSSKDVRVISPFVGGAFGSGLRPQHQLFFAVMAALALERSVRVSLTRQQMFTFGHRPNTIQNISLGAHTDGSLESITHDALAETSPNEDYNEKVVSWSGVLYDCANLKESYRVAHLDFPTPADMRAPGAVTGVWAIETAMDELSYKLKLDPLELRLKNYAYDDQSAGKPFSSKELKACYEQGAEKFGWSKRNSEPRSMTEGDNLIGWGMATGIWEVQQSQASAKAKLSADGKLEVGSGTADIGTGTYTVMTQIAAETMGLPLDDVTFKLGDSDLPQSPVEGGLWTVASNGSAVKLVCEAIKKEVFKLTNKMDHSPFADVEYEDVIFEYWQIISKTDGSKSVSIFEAMRREKIKSIEEEVTSAPDKARQSKYTMNSHSAIFAEVKIDEDLGTIHVTRVVSAIAGGRIINPKTARRSN
ncbi:MAG TPA: xanthine dehydrogenase family protein molybdopterin-binding subunit [Pyrinomonadaceae bacterium]|nr:xanthine dehydrogenase family protein molybdopterin-binding subunit [Pyrinomonadaceae bacterium]